MCTQLWLGNRAQLGMHILQREVEVGYIFIYYHLAYDATTTWSKSVLEPVSQWDVL